MSLELDAIQGIVITGYASLPATRYLFYRIERDAGRRQWLRELTNRVTTETQRGVNRERPNQVTNVAFTSEGLRKLGVPREALNTFPVEFVEGMAQRAGLLGDIGEDSPERWDVGGAERPVDVLIILYARELGELDRMSQYFESSRELREIYRKDAFLSGREPFGFRDGISQPGLEGSPVRLLPGQSSVKAGEFLIGYENEYGEFTTAPTIAETWDRMGYLQRDRQEPDRRDLGRNGSYLVVRKLVQDVKAFWAFFEEAAKEDHSADIELAKVKLASKCIGRWPSGAPLVLSPKGDSEELGSDSRNNLFDFTTDDPQGLSCPIGAHVRRANPRDSLPPDPVTSLRILRSHRIIRRGRPFGESMRASEAQGSDTESGLMFVALNANFETQFEFIQRNWIRGSAFGGLSDEIDPILGNDYGSMTIPERPVRRLLRNIPRFVTTRGGGYFFLPSVNTLKFLTTLG